MDEAQKKEAKFGDYVFVLYKWKRFLFVNLFIILLISILIAYLLPVQYRATATILIPQSEQTGLGGLTGLLGGNSSLASMGSRLLGVSNTSEDILLGIINSRTALTDIIKKFNLMEYYEIEDGNMDKVLKAFRGDISSDPNEFGMIDFSVINKDPETSAEIANYMVTLVDSMNIKFNIETAKNNRIFIERRYQQNVRDLKAAEDSLYKFQKKYGIVAVPEQLEVTVQAAAEIEAQLTRKEIESFFVEQTYGKNSPKYNGVMAEVKILRNKIQELKSSKTLGSTSNIFYPFQAMPDIAIEYLRTFRDVEIQQSILEIVLPMYEQAKVEEQKSMPTVMVIDSAVPPELKYSPKRSLVVIGMLFIFSFIFIPFVYWGEKSISREKSENALQVKESKFFNRVTKIYRMKF